MLIGRPTGLPPASPSQSRDAARGVGDRAARWVVRPASGYFSNLPGAGSFRPGELGSYVLIGRLAAPWAVGANGLAVSLLAGATPIAPTSW